MALRLHTYVKLSMKHFLVGTLKMFLSQTKNILRHQRVENKIHYHLMWFNFAEEADSISKKNFQL